VCHFIFASTFVTVVPPYLPWPLAIVYVSGVFELLGAGGLLVPRLRGLAAWGLFALTVAVTPANIYMWQTPSLVPSIPQWLLGWRLVLQVLLLATIAFVALRARYRTV
jgi:uncharacterized membrane protein